MSHVLFPDPRPELMDCEGISFQKINVGDFCFTFKDLRIQEGDKNSLKDILISHYIEVIAQLITSNRRSSIS